MRVAIYVRVSTLRQAQAQTIEQQLTRLEQHVVDQGWSALDKHRFRDDGYSGASLRRPGLERLRDAVAAGEVDRVLLTAPDRLARNYVHQALLLEEFGRGGCAVEFLDRPMSADPHDQLLLQIRGAVAEYERSVIAERMRRGRQMKLRAGLLLPWTRAPYGYRLDLGRPRDPAGVRIEAAEAPVVQELFATYVEEGIGLIGLAKALTRRGLVTPKGNARWNSATVRGILTNPSYTGQVYAGRSRARPPRGRHSALQPIGRPSTTQVPLPREEWIPVATIPALVSPEQFEQVQEKLAQNQQFARRNNTARDYLLRALVSCGHCRMACTGRSDRKKRYDYYVCRAKGPAVASHREERCRARFIPVQPLDDLVWQDLCAVLAHPASIAQALARAQGGHWSSQELQARREVLRKGVASLDQQLERLTEAYLGGVMPLAEYQRRRGEVEQKRQGLAQQHQHLEAQATRHLDVAAQVHGAEAFCQRVQAGLAEATFAQKRQLVELLIDRVVVTDDEVEIRYVVPTSSRGEHTRFCHLRLDYFAVPVLAPQRQQLRGRGARGRAGGDGVNDLLTQHRAGGLGDDAPLQPERLGQPRPVAVADQGRRGRQPSRLDPSAALAVRLDRRGRVGGGHGERRRHLPQEGRLIVLDREEIVAPARHDRLGDRPLRQQRVGGDDPPVQRQRQQQLARRADLVGRVGHRHLPQDHAQPVAQRGEEVGVRRPAFPAPPQRLPVQRSPLRRTRRGREGAQHLLRPAPQRRLHRRVGDPGEAAMQRRLARPVGPREPQPPQPWPTVVPPPGGDGALPAHRTASPRRPRAAAAATRAASRATHGTRGSRPGTPPRAARGCYHPGHSSGVIGRQATASYRRSFTTTLNRPCCRA